MVAIRAAVLDRNGDKKGGGASTRDSKGGLFGCLCLPGQGSKGATLHALKMREEDPAPSPTAESGPPRRPLSEGGERRLLDKRDRVLGEGGKGDGGLGKRLRIDVRVVNVDFRREHGAIS